MESLKQAQILAEERRRKEQLAREEEEKRRKAEAEAEVERKRKAAEEKQRQQQVWSLPTQFWPVGVGSFTRHGVFSTKRSDTWMRVFVSLKFWNWRTSRQEQLKRIRSPWWGVLYLPSRQCNDFWPRRKPRINCISDQSCASTGARAAEKSRLRLFLCAILKSKLEKDCRWHSLCSIFSFFLPLEPKIQNSSDSGAFSPTLLLSTQCLSARQSPAHEGSAKKILIQKYLSCQKAVLAFSFQTSFLENFSSRDSDIFRDTDLPSWSVGESKFKNYLYEMGLIRSNQGEEG